VTNPNLVTSVTGGWQGRPRRHISETLLARGARVRVSMRRIDERSDRLKSHGAEVVVGDFLGVVGPTTFEQFVLERQSELAVPPVAAGATARPGDRS
jgi:hypothetical protein